MAYVDGFVIPIPKKNMAAYKRMAATAGKVWRELGALDYKECVGDDLKGTMGCGIPFPKLAKTKGGETVVFSYILYKSKAHRDAVNKKVMKDPRIAKMLTRPCPFDANRMTHGGFKVLVDAKKK
jgi:uncharacterized protein YbaA (DUF1428 family)